MVWHVSAAGRLSRRRKPHGVPVYDFEKLDFYELLGVSRSASPEEIKRAYRREIARYHPDRFVNAGPEDLEYARRRSQLLTEAYATLSNPSARSAYNLDRRRRSTRKPPRPTPPPPPTQRDHQAELYQQARDHLAAGRYVQAIATLRQLHRINPFYRDSAELLADAESRLRSRATEKRSIVSPVTPRRLTLVVGVATVIALVGGAVWWLGAQNALRSADAGVVAPSGALLSPAPIEPAPDTPALATPLPTAPPERRPLPRLRCHRKRQVHRQPRQRPSHHSLPQHPLSRHRLRWKALCFCATIHSPKGGQQCAARHGASGRVMDGTVSLPRRRSG